MKRWSAFFVVLCLALSCGCGHSRSIEDAGDLTQAPTKPTEYPDVKVALLMDYANVESNPVNLAALDALTEGWQEDQIASYTPEMDSTDDRISAMEKAIKEGSSVLLCMGYSYADALKELAPKYPSVRFTAYGVRAGDFYDMQEADLPENLLCYNPDCTLEGYLTGYAAVQNGRHDIGLVAPMSVPFVLEYMYGFLQGADSAAAELGVVEDVTVRICSGNCFCEDTYLGPPKVVCENGAKTVFGVGYQQEQFERITLEHGAEYLSASMETETVREMVRVVLEQLLQGEKETLTGGFYTLLSPEEHYYGIAPISDAAYGISVAEWAYQNCTEEQLRQICKELSAGTRYCSDSIDESPKTGIKVDYLSNDH